MVDQEPWSYGEVNTAIARQIIEFRYQLLPYLYTTMWKYIKEAEPVLKPLPVAFPKDNNAYPREEEFIYGDKFLVSPALKQGAKEKTTYIPNGEWYNFNNDSFISGSGEVTELCPLGYIPMFVKAGSVIPMYPVIQYVGEKEIAEVYLHIYYINGVEESIYYEDDGDGYDYMNDKYLLQKFEVKGGMSTLEVLRHEEGKYQLTFKTYKITIHGLPFELKEIRINNKQVSYQRRLDKSTYSFSCQTNFNNIRII